MFGASWAAAEKFVQAENPPKKMRPAENPPGENWWPAAENFFG